MLKCTVCGLGNDDNPAHKLEFKGIGAHGFVAATQDDEMKAFLDEILINFGGELKSLGEGKFEGYLVRYSSADDPDLVGDYFTKSTQFFVDDGAVIPVLYDHGLNATMKKTKIGRAKVAYDDAGLFIKGELEVADAYKDFVKEIQDKLVSAKKAGLSSGAASHMVTRKKVKKGVSEILEWGIAEASITPAPTEPRCEAQSLKSYLDWRSDPLEVKSESGEGMNPTAATVPHEFSASADDPTVCSVCGEEFAEGVHTKAIKTIKQETRDGKKKFVLYTKDGSKELGVHDTRMQAMQHETAINMAKKKTKAVDDEEDPEEGLAKSVMSMKDLFSSKLKALWGHVKGMFAEKLAEKTPAVWEVRNVLDCVYSDIAQAAAISDITGVTIDVESKVKEAKMEEASYEIPLVVKQINDWVEKYSGSSNGDYSSNRFYLRSLPDTENTETNVEESVKGGLGNGLTLDEHSDRVVNAVEELANLSAKVGDQVKAYTERCTKKLEYRAKDPHKSGRTLSKATIAKITAIKEAQQQHIQELDALLGSATQAQAAGEAAAEGGGEKSMPDTSLLAMDFQMNISQAELALEGL